MTDTLGRPGTSPGVVAAPDIPPQGTLTIEQRAADLAEHAGHLRIQTALINSDAADIQHEAFQIQLDARTSQLVKTGPAQLLDSLSELGFAWRDIARMVGVSVPALRRWRNGERPSGENRRAIAQLLAFVDIINRELLVFEPASWMEVPIVRSAPTTPIDLYARGWLEIVFDLASEHCSPESALDLAEPGWRENYRSDWEVSVGADGQRYIRRKPER